MGAAALVLAATLVLCFSASGALKNGLALTPALGFNTWNSFGPDISEDLVRATADLMVSLGLAEVGYKYLIVDDGWSEPERDRKGRLVPSRSKFPSGMRALTNYIHSKGLKFGMYGDAGGFTCGHLPGSRGYEEMDAQTWADWGVDYLKYDNCWARPGDPTRDRYQAMRDALNRTGRPVVFSLCEWGMEEPWLWAAQIGNSWRTTTDIHPAWDILPPGHYAGSQGVLSILDNSAGLSRFAGPGGWNDLDMLEVGIGDLTQSQQRSHFALWALLKSPLLIGADLRNLSPDALVTLKSRELLAVNQDELGVPGELVWKQGPREIYACPLADGSRAAVLFNRHSIFSWQVPADYPPSTMTVHWEQVGLKAGSTAAVRDLYREEDLGRFNGSFTATVAVHDVMALKVTPCQGPGSLQWRPWDGQPIFAASPEDSPADSAGGTWAGPAGLGIDTWQCTVAVTLFLAAVYVLVARE